MFVIEIKGDRLNFDHVADAIGFTNEYFAETGILLGIEDKASYECADCEYTTDSDMWAYNHSKTTRHCVEDWEGAHTYCRRADH